MTTVGELLAEARPRLAATSFGAPPREALLLLGFVLGRTEAQLLARPEREVGAEEAERFRAVVARRLTGEPTAYLFGEREFYGRPFHVDSRVLIPRPETEHLIEEALFEPLPEGARVLDVATGSGCIAVTLALESPGSRVVGSDLSPAALAVAAGNARRHGVAGRVPFVGLDLVAGLDLARFDLVVSNPPYIDRSEAPGLSPEVCNFEPHLALFPPGGGGVETISRLLVSAAALRPGVRVLLEIGRGQLEAVEAAARAAGFDLLSARPDYAGIPRVAVLSRF
jgi:release factor glutamine methyltransferase